MATANGSSPGQLGAGQPRHLQGPTDVPAAGRRGSRRDGGSWKDVLHEMVGVASVSPIGHIGTAVLDLGCSTCSRSPRQLPQ
ncbi:hypothetical protein N7532_009874 [Penicillium argentinense]|uniref:Uncharacterized protein n=1 Tax=Penicillium argentinense TaxID=1131581 RepID=A0A9W9ENH9_9EURO|nr:uncharacterized protein N7532_009874 [Penicillium argentinense]KAJ5085103.1 hypothetical protein N7532_009874 [Penicillium argentinense]